MTEISPAVELELTRWVHLEEVPRREDLVDRCARDKVAEALAHLSNVEAMEVRFVDGDYESPDGLIEGLPEFFEVLLHVHNPGGHVAHVRVWLPLRWNGRFLGITGTGNRTVPAWNLAPYLRIATSPHGVRNGFATACTDGGNRDEREFTWALDEATGEIDWDLIENWVHRSTREMTIAAKAVVELVYGEPPAFSYLAGSSGGGRQTLVHAQRYPDDYDGYWASDPAINWTKIDLVQLWPALVMKELDNALPAAKLEAFRAAALSAFAADHGVVDGVIMSSEYQTWDPAQLVGQETPAGAITERDAETMRMIWGGPRRRDGRFLWFGFGIDTEPWAEWGAMCTKEVDGKLVPVVQEWGVGWVASWLLRDPTWDWTTLTFEAFEELFDQSTTEYASVDGADADLAALRDSGAKLLLTHGMADEDILSRGTVDYYERVLKHLDGDEDVASWLRFFLSPGDIHSRILGHGPGLTLASGMAALMAWVEDGIAPDVIPGTAMDKESGEIILRRPICRYPQVASYLGGDPTDPASFGEG
ncbi:putative Tannase and feruloyl esterase family protein [metagenome]|uniref:Putative Tannase and feruloyl esterase family protein n=1 Tax=metagenome TaxID=256318 RepID=A0A2P2C7J4_9ZZZZ